MAINEVFLKKPVTTNIDFRTFGYIPYLHMNCAWCGKKLFTTNTNWAANPIAVNATLIACCPEKDKECGKKFMQAVKTNQALTHKEVENLYDWFRGLFRLYNLNNTGPYLSSKDEGRVTPLVNTLLQKIINNRVTSSPVPKPIIESTLHDNVWISKVGIGFLSTGTTAIAIAMDASASVSMLRALHNLLNDEAGFPA